MKFIIIEIIHSTVLNQSSLMVSIICSDRIANMHEHDVRFKYLRHSELSEWSIHLGEPKGSRAPLKRSMGQFRAHALAANYLSDRTEMSFVGVSAEATWAAVIPPKLDVMGNLRGRKFFDSFIGSWELRIGVGIGRTHPVTILSPFSSQPQ